MSAFPPPAPKPRSPLRDLLGGVDPYEAAVRFARTALQAFVAALLAVPVLDVTALQAAGFAALTAVLTLAHGWLSPSSDTRN